MFHARIMSICQHHVVVNCDNIADYKLIVSLRSAATLLQRLTDYKTASSLLNDELSLPVRPHNSAHNIQRTPNESGRRWTHACSQCFIKYDISVKPLFRSQANTRRYMLMLMFLFQSTAHCSRHKLIDVLVMNEFSQLPLFSGHHSIPWRGPTDTPH